MGKALITGITGQDGSYLADLLLEKDYAVYGMIRHPSSPGTDRIDHLCQNPQAESPRLTLLYGDLGDSATLNQIIDQVKPDEVYNLGGQSRVSASFDMPEYTVDVAGVGAIRILEAIRRCGVPARYYQASTSEMYGIGQEVPQTETTPFHPRSPYGVAKLFAYWATVNYRETYGMYACNGILFNHESPRRGEAFVTRKITLAAARIKLGLQHKLYLGNLDARRDWGYAKEYVEGMWRMLQQDKPDDYVLATGESHSVREFLEAAFSYLDLDYRDYTEIDPRYNRPSEVDRLVGDASKAQRQLGWAPKTTFRDLVRLMVDSDIKQAEQEKASGKEPS